MGEEKHKDTCTRVLITTETKKCRPHPPLFTVVFPPPLKLVATFRSSSLIKNKSRSRALSFRGKSSSANSSSSSKATMIFNETSSSSSKAEGKKCEQQRKQETKEQKWEKKAASFALATLVATSLAVADCSVLNQRAEASTFANEITQVAGRCGGGMRGGGGRSYRSAPRGGGQYRRGPPPRAVYGPTVMPMPVPIFSPFGFGMPFGFGYGMPFGFFGGGGFIFQLFMLAFVVNVVSGFFNAADQSRYDEYERDEWERDQNKSIDEDDFSDDWRKRR